MDLSDMTDSTMTISGVDFKVLRQLASATEGVETLLVEQDGCRYALKLYDAAVAPDPQVLAALLDTNHGYVSSVIGTGRHQNRVYEILPYYTGGSLADKAGTHDPTTFKAVALAMVMCLKAVHEVLGISHGDVREGNFYYTDNTGEQLVIGNFRKAIQHPSQTDIKKDYLHLGQTLTRLWGNRPMPDDVAYMIKGFTAGDQASRWGFDEFARWLRGENVTIEPQRRQPDAAFKGVGGNDLTTLEEIARDIMYYPSEYTGALKKPDARLYKFSDAHGLELREHFLEKFRAYPAGALWQLVFTLDPEAGFPLFNPVSGSVTYCKDIKQLLDTFARLPMNVYSQVAYTKGKDSIPSLLYDEAFTIWLTHRDPAIAGRVVSALQGVDNYGCDLYYYILYLLDDRRNFFFADDTGRDYTMQQLAGTMNDTYNEYKVRGRCADSASTAKKLLDCLRDHRDHRLGYYMKARDYSRQAAYIDHCFDFNTRDRQRQAGPYNEDIAYYRIFKGLGGQAFYRFPVSGVEAASVDDLARVPRPELLEESRDGRLRAWLAVQYQENPHADLSRPFAYESLLEQYTAALGNIDPDANEVIVHRQIKDVLDKDVRHLRRLRAQVWTVRALWALFVAVPALVLAFLFPLCGLIDFPEPQRWGKLWTPVLSLALLLRLVQILPKMTWALSLPFGYRLGDWMKRHRWILSLSLSAGVTYFLAFINNYGAEYGKWVLCALCLLVFGVSLKKVVLDLPLCNDFFRDKISGNQEGLLAAPLFHAWRDDGSGTFDAEIVDDIASYRSDTEGARDLALYKTFRWFIAVLLLGAMFAVTSVPGDRWTRARCPQLYERADAKRAEKARKAKAAPSPNYEVTGVKTSLTVRQAPSVSSPAIGHLANGRRITVTDYDTATGFASIDYNGGVGYVSIKYIKPLQK